jgi:hypothetical protein
LTGRASSAALPNVGLACATLCTYLGGGTGDDRALGVAVDVSGNADVTGQPGVTPYQGASGVSPGAFVG